MVYISFVELLAGANAALRETLGTRAGAFAAIGAFFGGMLLSALIDKMIPEVENPHSIHTVEDLHQPHADRKALGRAGLLFALAIGIHNFPEGLATFAAGMNGWKLGLPIALAIAVHNIPEGIAVSVPLFYGTGSRKKAFWYSALTGLAEPAGALVGYLLLRPFLTETVLQLTFATVAGVMVYITFDELLPMAHRYGHHHLTLYGLIAGMAVMAVCLAF